MVTAINFNYYETCTSQNVKGKEANKLLLMILCQEVSVYISNMVYNQGRIQAVFEIGNRFWAHKNRRPNFDRSKDETLILFNSR